jgi:hypothetical protein
VSEDWKVGDLAVCVDARPNPMVASSIEAGRVYRVVGLFLEPHSTALFPLVSCGLFLAGVPCASKSGSWSCNRFRKIRPDEHEDCEPEFVELLKRSRVKA